MQKDGRLKDMTLSLNSNNLLTTLEVFSRIACLDGRGFGVVTPCEECSIEFNICIRRSLLENLIANQSKVEDQVGYNLTERWHMQEIVWDGTPTRIQLDWPGVVEVGASANFDVFDETYELSPFVIENAPVTDSGDGYCIVELDKEMINNPRYATIRDATDNSIYKQQKIDGYPRRNVDGNWLVALDHSPDCADLEVNVQHCRLMKVTIPIPDCDGEVKAVRPGTEDIIPFAEEKEPIIEGDNITYWFYNWSLVDEAFMEETVNLDNGGEFYKLMQEIQFACLSSGEAPTTVTTLDNCQCTDLLTTTNDLINVEILFSQSSVIRISYQENCNCSCMGQPVKLKIYYKTDPSYVIDEGSLYALQEGIVYLTAAELPLDSCGCKVEKGFIAEAQKQFAQARINPITGETIINIEFQQLNGQLVFRERMAKAYKHHTLVKL